MSRDASDGVRDQINDNLNREVEFAAEQEKRLAYVQDPAGMSDRRTFGKGGPCRYTGAEIAEKMLRKNARQATVVDLTSPSSSQQHQQSQALISSPSAAPVIMTFSHSGEVIRSETYPHRQPTGSARVASTVSKSQEVEYLDITVLGLWGPKEALAPIHAANSTSENSQIGCEKPYLPPPVSFPKLPLKYLLPSLTVDSDQL